MFGRILRRGILCGLMVVGLATCSFDASTGLDSADVGADECSPSGGEQPRGRCVAARDVETDVADGSGVDMGNAEADAPDADPEDSGDAAGDTEIDIVDTAADTVRGDTVDARDAEDGSVDAGDSSDSADVQKCEPSRERCDDGVDNDCDGQIDADDEDCLPGGSCHTDDHCLGVCAESNKCAHRIFVTSTAYDGDLGGIMGADKKCNKVAGDEGLDGQWMAVVSVGATNDSARRRIDLAAALYNMNENAEVVAQKNDLWDGSIDNPVAFDESGKKVSGETDVWTGTHPDGSADADCKQWTTNSPPHHGQEGDAHAKDESWVTDLDGIVANKYHRGCSADLRLYCIEVH